MILFFFFNDPAPTEIYTLSLHDALPIFVWFHSPSICARSAAPSIRTFLTRWSGLDRKSTRLNSSHVKISYAVFCLKKKKLNNKHLKNQLPLLFLVAQAFQLEVFHFLNDP